MSGSSIDRALGPPDRCAKMRRNPSGTASVLAMLVAVMFAQALVAGLARAELPPSSHRIEIAGEPLPGFPHFEFVRAFDEARSVRGAIDPQLGNGLAGHTADVYVVESRSVAGWLRDGRLIDVRGEPRRMTFDGADIRASTFELAAPWTLDAGDRHQIGRGYDVVLDVDLDGRLGPADHIDGLGDEAGFYIVHDLTQAGPHEVDEAVYSGGVWRGQITYYPRDIAGLGALPLIVVSHGNGHDYTWYGHIGRYFASYGYVVMSHENNVGPGPDAAATATIDNTDYLVANQGVVAGGVLAGHIDASRIVWIGHSRGAEGIARAVQRLVTGATTPEHFGIGGLKLLSAMAPTDFLKNPRSHPHDVPFHVWTASGDTDVEGSASCDVCQTFHLHDRATGPRHSTVIQGAGHDDFHTEPGEPAAGACPIGEQAQVHAIVLSHLHALVAHYVHDNVPAADFLWRDYDRFHPSGVDLRDPCVVVTHEYRPPARAGRFVIDDFQREPSTVVSSSGGRVAFSVEHLVEGVLDDADATFEWREDDPFNGATQASARDSGRGIAFDWNGSDRFVAWTVEAPDADFSAFSHLSLRAAQATRHPLTLARDEPLDFSVTLRDRRGVERSIRVGQYGAGLVEPYDRDGGWHNEMATVRIRLDDFGRGGGGPDLASIAQARLDFGPGYGAPEGRIVLDELVVTGEAPGERGPDAWRIELSTDYDGERIAFEVEASAPQPATFSVYLILLGPVPTMVQLWSAPIEATRVPRVFGAEVPFALLRPAALVSTLFVEGIEAHDIVFVSPDVQSGSAAVEQEGVADAGGAGP